MCMLQGVRFAQVEATPICGLAKSPSWKPTARSMARAGACFTPSTTRLVNVRACRIDFVFGFARFISANLFASD